MREKFFDLKESICEELKDTDISQSELRYMINRASNYIRRANFDIYMITVSLKPLRDAESYNAYTTIKSNRFTLFMMIRVD